MFKTQGFPSVDVAANMVPVRKLVGVWHKNELGPHAQGVRGACDDCWLLAGAEWMSNSVS